MLAHFNRLAWRSYASFNEIGLFYSLDYKRNVVITVGQDNPIAVIYMGKR